MSLTDDFHRVDLSRILVTRDKRQRRRVYDEKGNFINSDGLLGSVAARGVINPIVVTRDFTLIAGERRFEASKVCGKLDIPVRFVEDMSGAEQRILELEENLRRVDLPWRDEVEAVAELHRTYLDANPKWTRVDTERAIGYGQLDVALRVAQDLHDPKIADAGGVRAAYNILARRDERATADAVNDIIDAGIDLFGPRADERAGHPPGGTGHPTDGGAATPGGPYVAPPPPPPLESIQQGDFVQWADAYAGPSFNFIHCDFPYGINVFAGALSGRDTQTTYSDTRDVYEGLIKALCRNLPRLMSNSAHLMFWLSADVEIMWRTREMFRVLAPSLVFWPKPLLWHKTDNVGIVADPKRGPRHVYEAALVASQEDRQIIRSVSDAYGAPTDKSHHTSTKPEPVLRHFLQMFVDEHSRVLDPTCGSGSALRAAESLGASYTLGLERDPEHFRAAQSALRTFRTLRKVSK